MPTEPGAGRRVDPTSPDDASLAGPLPLGAPGSWAFVTAVLAVLPSCYAGDTPPHKPVKAKMFMDERAKLQRTDAKEKASAKLTEDVLNYVI